VIDTALALILRESFTTVIGAAQGLRATIGERAKEFRTTLCAGRTHGVHAEPTTFGLRIAGWFTEISRNIERLEDARKEISVGKLSGAVGNFSQTDPEFEAFVLDRLGLNCEPVATQVVPRDRHARALSTLALLGAGMERIAVDIRGLQRTELREAEEPFRAGQTGSSAMPHKRNPITSERITGMARLLRGYMTAAYENVALWHERDISHSSVERVILPDAFHTAHYMILKLTALIRDLRVYPEAMQANIERSGGLIFSQSVLGLLLRSGLERQDAYKLVQRNAMRVWEGEATHLKDALLADDEVTSRVPPEQLETAFEPARYQRHVDVLFKRAGID
jgi:adenylosuccinate lyase